MFIKEALMQRSKSYWVFVLLTVTLSYGFTLTHYSMGVDDDSFKEYFHEGVLLSQGRWGSSLTKYFFDTYEFLPFWRDFIAIILITLGITLWGHILKKNSNGYFNETGIIVFACIAISCPFIANIFIFMMTTIEVGLVLCLTAISINSYIKWSQKESRLINLLISIFSLVYAVSFSELAMIFFLLGLFIVAFLTISFSEVKRERKSLVFFLLNGSFLMVSVLITGNIMKVILQEIFNAPPSGYVSNMVLYDFSNLSSFTDSFLVFLKSLLSFFLTRDHPGVKIAVFSTIIILIYSIFLSIKKREALLFLIGVGLVISAYSLFILTGNVDIPYRTMITNSVFVGFTIAFAFMTLLRKFNQDKIIINVMLILVFMLIFHQTKYINGVFYTDYLRFQLDKTKADVIATDIMSESGKTTNKVVFIGQPDNYNLKIGDVEGYSIFQWGRFGGSANELKHNRSILSFINLQGYSVQGISDIGLDEVLSQSADMPIFPAKGYVKNVGDYLIVKMGYTPELVEIDNHQFANIKQAGENLKYSIDLFSYDNEHININGWAFLDDEKETNGSVSIALVNKENKYYMSAQLTPRQDVLNAFPHLKKSENLGFQLVFPTSLVRNGTYDIALVYNSDFEIQIKYLDKSIVVE